MKPQPKQDTTEQIKVTAGDAVWKEHREGIAKRNAETKKKAQVERESRDGLVGARMRADEKREAEHLVVLNERLAKRRRAR